MWVAHLSVLQRMQALPVTAACATTLVVRRARLAFLRSLHPIDHRKRDWLAQAARERIFGPFSGEEVVFSEDPSEGAAAGVPARGPGAPGFNDGAKLRHTCEGGITITTRMAANFRRVTSDSRSAARRLHR